MVLPSDDQCKRVIDLLKEEPTLTEWEHSFIESNLGRKSFSPSQKDVISRLLEKYECS